MDTGTITVQMDINDVHEGVIVFPHEVAGHIDKALSMLTMAKMTESADAGLDASTRQLLAKAEYHVNKAREYLR